MLQQPKLQREGEKGMKAEIVCVGVGWGACMIEDQKPQDWPWVEKTGFLFTH